VSDRFDPMRFLDDCGDSWGVATDNLAHADEHEHDHGHPTIPLEDTMITTRLTERFLIKHPIVCAPMALVTVLRPGRAAHRDPR
jgi:hypothetical protein